MDISKIFTVFRTESSTNAAAAAMTTTNTTYTTAIIISIVIIVVWSSKYSTITDFMIFCFHNHYLHNSN